MTPYARQPGSDTWHFRPDCSSYPVAHDTIKRESRPTSGLLCLECKSLERREEPREATQRR